MFNQSFYLPREKQTNEDLSGEKICINLRLYVQEGEWCGWANSELLASFANWPKEWGRRGDGVEGGRRHRKGLKGIAFGGEGGI